MSLIKDLEQENLVVNLNFDCEADDGDAVQVLKEFIDSQSGAVFDQETEPGSDNVTPLAHTWSSHTLAFDNGVATDVVTLQGIGVENGVAKLTT